MSNRLIFTGQRQVSFIPTDIPAVPGPGQVRIRAVCSLISTGTEGIVFNRLFDAGTHWDNWVKYPFTPGYSLIAEVEAVGAGVTTVPIGQRVAARLPHVSHAVINAGDCIPVPAGIDPHQAAWFALAKITFIGVRAAAPALGDDVLVVGAGPIGQMVTRWLHAFGVRNLVIADPMATRMDLARRGGASGVVAKPLADAGAEITEAFGGKRPRVVMDSTGNAHVFAAALGAVRDRGKVVIMGDTGSPASQKLTSDVITRGLTIVGAHDGHGDAEWNDQTISALFFRMLADGRINLDGMESHAFAPQDCAAAYDLITTRRSETMGVIFDWTGATKAVTLKAAAAGA
jgi:2-desacetyl-2-hydroxyethyl bacteriochlorophyllide A dehydrogenase